MLPAYSVYTHYYVLGIEVTISPPKPWCPPIMLHYNTSQKTSILIFTALKASNLTIIFTVKYGLQGSEGDS
jgi:hypothetical protein